MCSKSVGVIARWWWSVVRCGIGEDDVDVAEPVEGGCDGGVEGGLIGDIGGEGGRPGAELGGEGGQQVGFDADQAEVGAFGVQATGDVGSDTTRGAGDEHGLAGDGEYVGHEIASRSGLSGRAARAARCARMVAIRSVKATSAASHPLWAGGATMRLRWPGSGRTSLRDRRSRAG